jgi:hypothetical protein
LEVIQKASALILSAIETEQVEAEEASTSEEPKAPAATEPEVSTEHTAQIALAEVA